MYKIIATVDIVSINQVDSGDLQKTLIAHKLTTVFGLIQSKCFLRLEAMDEIIGAINQEEVNEKIPEPFDTNLITDEIEKCIKELAIFLFQLKQNKSEEFFYSTFILFALLISVDFEQYEDDKKKQDLFSLIKRKDEITSSQLSDEKIFDGFSNFSSSIFVSLINDGIQISMISVDDISEYCNLILEKLKKYKNSQGQFGSSQNETFHFTTLVEKLNEVITKAEEMEYSRKLMLGQFKELRKDLVDLSKLFLEGVNKKLNLESLCLIFERVKEAETKEEKQVAQLVLAILNILLIESINQLIRGEISEDKNSTHLGQSTSLDPLGDEEARAVDSFHEMVSKLSDEEALLFSQDQSFFQSDPAPDLPPGLSPPPAAAAALSKKPSFNKPCPVAYCKKNSYTTLYGLAKHLRENHEWKLPVVRQMFPDGKGSYVRLFKDNPEIPEHEIDAVYQATKNKLESSNGTDLETGQEQFNPIVSTQFDGFTPFETTNTPTASPLRNVSAPISTELSGCSSKDSSTEQLQEPNPSPSVATTTVSTQFSAFTPFDSTKTPTASHLVNLDTRADTSTELSSCSSKDDSSMEKLKHKTQFEKSLEQFCRYADFVDLKQILDALNAENITPEEYLKWEENDKKYELDREGLIEILESIFPNKYSKYKESCVQFKLENLTKKLKKLLKNKKEDESNELIQYFVNEFMTKDNKPPETYILNLRKINEYLKNFEESTDRGDDDIHQMVKDFHRSLLVENVMSANKAKRDTLYYTLFQFNLALQGQPLTQKELEDLSELKEFKLNKDELVWDKDKEHFVIKKAAGAHLAPTYDEKDDEYVVHVFHHYQEGISYTKGCDGNVFLFDMLKRTGKIQTAKDHKHPGKIYSASFSFAKINRCPWCNTNSRENSMIIIKPYDSTNTQTPSETLPLQSTPSPSSFSTTNKESEGSAQRGDDTKSTKQMDEETSASFTTYETLQSSTIPGASTDPINPNQKYQRIQSKKRSGNDDDSHRPKKSTKPVSKTPPRKRKKTKNTDEEFSELTLFDSLDEPLDHIDDEIFLERALAASLNDT